MVIEANEDEENIHTQQQPNTTLQYPYFLPYLVVLIFA